MDAYISNYLAQGTSQTLKKLYCLNPTKQQSREHQSQHKKILEPFDVSKFIELDRDFLKMFHFEHTK